MNKKVEKKGLIKETILEQVRRVNQISLFGILCALFCRCNIEPRPIRKPLCYFGVSFHVFSPKTNPDLLWTWHFFFLLPFFEKHVIRPMGWTQTFPVYRSRTGWQCSRPAVGRYAKTDLTRFWGKFLGRQVHPVTPIQVPRDEGRRIYFDLALVQWMNIIFTWLRNKLEWNLSGNEQLANTRYP